MSIGGVIAYVGTVADEDWNLKLAGELVEYAVTIEGYGVVVFNTGRYQQAGNVPTVVP
jgi:hypothetical protein